MDQIGLQALVDSQINRSHIYNAVIGIQSRDNRIHLSAGAGLANAASGAPMTPDTPYFIASITKMYTATVIVRLHEQGLLDLAAPIATYLSPAAIRGIHVFEGRDYSDQISVMQLINHTSGLADYEADRPKGGQSILDQLKQGQDIGLDTEQVLEVVRRLSPHFAPGAAGGTKAYYSNTNYRLLGAIIEAVTGRSVAEIFDQMIFKPLSLTHTYLFDAGSSRPDQEPADIYLKDQVARLPKYLASNKTDGGIVSTVGDSLIFLRALFDGQLFDKTTLDRMTARWNRIFFPLQYGFGLMRFRLPRIFWPFQRLPTFVGHSGSISSFAFYCPDRDLYLAGTFNQVAAPGKPFWMMTRIALNFKPVS